MANQKQIGARGVGMRLNFNRKVVAEIVKAVTRFECGTLVVQMPNRFVKSCQKRPTWFDDRGISFLWSQLIPTLSWKLPGVNVEELKLGKEEWLPSIPSVGTATAPCN